MASERLTDDLLVEILSRVPAKSMCRFKCVSKHWLNLTHHPDHHRKLPQALAGFFYNRTNTSDKRLSGSALNFASITDGSSTPVDTCFAFLPNHSRVELLDCCSTSGQADDVRYVVCNPVTEEWGELPKSDHACMMCVVCLVFDPAVSPHFHVFVLLLDQSGYCINAMDIYSSVHKEKRWKGHIELPDHQHSASIYLDGRLHFQAFVREENTLVYTHQLAILDTKRETWSTIRAPSAFYLSFIQQSQGRLLYAGFKRDGGANGVQLLLYVLKDYDSKEWILSHSVVTSSIFGGRHASFHRDHWIAVHPHCNMIFFAAGSDMTFICYDMDRGQVKVICNLERGMPPFVPFVPLYADLPSLHK